MVVLSLLGLDDQLVDHVEIPPWVIDLGAFRRWMGKDDFPDEGRIDYIKGEVWVDMSKEQVFTHVLVKTRITAGLSELVEANEWGIFLGDGILLSNVDADIAVNSDALFASNDALADRVRILEGKKGGYVELEGSPDMVLEVVSTSSVRKDTERLRRDYWEAGITEYWLVDARKESLIFDILRHTPKGYRTTPKKDGWVKSVVFGKSFRLIQRIDVQGRPKYILEVR
ncbi:MAG TPA: Uma2 family endonuclease [Gemmataceae bacterium]|nr:Uma2 family endonuclease [Gemmataceae bacterium]